MREADSREPFHTHLRIEVLDDALSEKNQSYCSADENCTPETVEFSRRIIQITRVACDSRGLVLASPEVLDQMFGRAQRERQNADGGGFVGAIQKHAGIAHI